MSTDSDLDDILSEVGEFGPYQIVTIIAFSVLKAISGPSLVTHMITSSPLNHRCKIPECEIGNNNRNLPYDRPWVKNAIPLKDGKLDNCHRFAPKNTTIIEPSNQCSADMFDTYILHVESKTIMFWFELMTIRRINDSESKKCLLDDSWRTVPGPLILLYIMVKYRFYVLLGMTSLFFVNIRSEMDMPKLLAVAAECKTTEKATELDFINLKMNVQPKTRSMKCLTACMLEKVGKITNRKFDSLGEIKIVEKNTQISSKLQKTVTEVITECGSIVDPDRGCTSDLAESPLQADPNCLNKEICETCFGTNNYNRKLIESENCLVCSSKDDSWCKSNAYKEMSKKCPLSLITMGCFLSIDDSEVTRGCMTSLDQSTRENCQQDNGSVGHVSEKITSFAEFVLW